jgi:hypothetical protein
VEPDAVPSAVRVDHNLAEARSSLGEGDAADRNSRWFLYDDVAPSRDVGPLLAEIDEDPTGIFWG